MWSQEETAAALTRDAHSNAGLLQVLRRGTAELARADDRGILLRDTISGIWMAGGLTGDVDWLRAFSAELLMAVCGAAEADAVKEALGAVWMEPCDQYLFLGERPPEQGTLRIAEVTPAELEVVASRYEMLSRADLERVAAHHTLFAGHDGSGELVGFAGSHLEGAMGILEVMPAYRRKGYAAELERYVIRYFMKNGLIPFGQVTAENTASAALQRKLGMTKAPLRAYWMGQAWDE